MIAGSIVALVTPMHPDGRLDKDALERLVAFHLDEGTDGIVAVGTTGESATLNVDEHCQVIEWIIDMVAGQVPVIAGTGANCTREAIHLTQKAEALKADACLSVTPYYNKPTQAGMLAHYQAISAASSLPLLLYNVPGRTCSDILPETVATLSDTCSSIIGIKDATADLSRLEQMKAICRPDFIYLSGDDATAKDFVLAGGHGVISVTTNVAPKAMKSLCDAARAGNTEEANAIDASIEAFHHKLFIESSPIPCKWMLNKMGLIEAGIRLPLTWLLQENEEQLIPLVKQLEQ